MSHNELISNLTLKAIDNMRLSDERNKLSTSEYTDYVTERVIDAYLKITNAVINGEKPE